MEFESNQIIVINSTEIPVLSKELIDRGSYIAKASVETGGTVIWTETSYLEDMDISTAEENVLSNYVACPVCNSFSSTLVVDYRSIDGCLSVVNCCFDCKYETDESYRKIKSMTTNEKYEYVKKEVVLNIA